MTSKSDLHTPSELLVAAHKLFDAGDVHLLRPAVLEAMTCLESYVQAVVFKALSNKLDPLLVKWLEDKTRMDFDTRLHLLTPIATGHPITKEGSLGGARHQVRRFLWLFGRVWTEALLLPLKAVCRTDARNILARQFGAKACLSRSRPRAYRAQKADPGA
jgi:hypothetical protein